MALNETGGTLRTLRRRLVRTVQMLRGSRVPDERYSPLRHGPVVGDRQFPDEEIERYWLKAPYSYAVITYDEGENQHV